MAGTTVALGGPQAAASLVRRDPRFAPLKQRFGPARVETGRQPFEALVRSITSQQLSVAAAATVFQRVHDLCGGHVTPDGVATWGHDDLRACGLSNAKARYVLGAAAAVSSGAVALDDLAGRTDCQVLQELTSLSGVGVWTAQMLLIFTFHRPDVLPTGDLGIVDAARMVFRLPARPSVSELEVLAAPWRPYRSVASWYLWKERDRRVRQ